MGRIGVEMAYERLDGEDGRPRQRTIDCAVVARGSGELPAP
jgi:DNA-binding LacI/PurR family transcriptional regulator